MVPDPSLRKMTVSVELCVREGRWVGGREGDDEPWEICLPIFETQTHTLPCRRGMDARKDGEVKRKRRKENRVHSCPVTHTDQHIVQKYIYVYECINICVCVCV